MSNINDPYIAIGAILNAGPEAFEAELGRPFSSSSSHFPLTAAQRHEGTLRDAARAKPVPAAAPAAPTKKLTKSDYATKLEASLRRNPEYAQLVHDISTKIVLGIDPGDFRGYEPDVDADVNLADLVGDDGE